MIYIYEGGESSYLQVWCFGESICQPVNSGWYCRIVKKWLYHGMPLCLYVYHCWPGCITSFPDQGQWYVVKSQRPPTQMETPELQWAG